MPTGVPPWPLQGQEVQVPVPDEHPQKCLHAGGSNFLFGDGSIKFLANSADRVLPALASRNGGEMVSSTDY